MIMSNHPFSATTNRPPFTFQRRFLALALFVLLVLINVFQVKLDSISTKLSTQPKSRMIRTAKGLLPRCVDKIHTKSSRKRNVNMTFVNRHEFEKCQFTPVEDGGPIPVIFIVNGRSGSDATWATLSALAGGKSPIGEHTGENKVKAMDFLGRMTEEEGSWWVSEHLCQFAHLHCDKPLAAFKWKPFVDSWELPAAQGMLNKIATFDDPKIKVIFMTRNPLDVLISKTKHHASGAGHQLEAHCAPDDWECIQQHIDTGRGLVMPVDTLLQDLEEAESAFKMFSNSLERMNVHYIKTTYEDLYAQDHAEEWMRIFKFLGRGPTQNLTMTDVVDSFTMAPTAAKHHNESLANYDEISNLLLDTDYERLLH